MATITNQNSITKLSEKMECEIEILTPVHVGSGNKWHDGIDYIEEEGSIWVFNQDKLFLRLHELARNRHKTALDEYTQKLSRDKRDAATYVKRLIDDGDIDIDDICDVSFSFNGGAASEIREIMRDGNGHTYIPGSSIKGAIRSAIYNALHTRMGAAQYGKRVDELLGNFESSTMRYIMPSDVYMEQVEINNIALFNLNSSYGGWRSTYKNDNMRFVSAETFSIGGKGKFALNIANNFFHKVVQWYDTSIVNRNTKEIIREANPIQFLFNIINEYTQQHIDKEIAFFEKYSQAPNTHLIIQQLQALRAQATNNADSCILRLSYGGGFHAMTGDYKYKDHVEIINNPERNGARYKSRRIVNNARGYFPMGFVKISLPANAARIQYTAQAEYRPSTKLSADSDVLLAPIKKVAEKINNATTMDASTLKEGDPLYVRVIKLGKPFGRAELLLSNYHFPLEVNLSGTKGVDLTVGDIVKVFVNSKTKEGEIKAVTLQK